MTEETHDPLAYYATPGPTTDAGQYAHLFRDLPQDIPSLVRVVQGVLLHIFWAERYGVTLSDERKLEVNLRTVEAQLARMTQLNAQPLTIARPPEQRLVGNCRDFSVL
ncbi:MAG: transglutaminase domain-containing protein, partial [Chloroflexi bacterium]|nr:transglutaminase domain-containing protein [Chloroflexota bacterium]